MNYPKLKTSTLVRLIAEAVFRDEEAEAELDRRIPAPHAVHTEQKKRVLDDFTKRGQVLLTIDARVEGVRVPKPHNEDKQLVLRVGPGLTPPVTLEINDDELRAWLVFSGTPFPVVVPWEALYAMRVEGTERGAFWPDDMPDDIEIVTQTAAQPEASPARRGLSLVPAEDE